METRAAARYGPAVALVLAGGVLVWTLSDDPGSTSDPPTADDVEVPASDPCANATTVVLEPTLPTAFGGSQLDADCIAWQQFIHLNWTADPSMPGHPDPTASPSSFGTPGDTSATVWESYLEADQVFGEGNVEAEADWSAARSDVKNLGRSSKVAETELELSAIAQAGDNKWLTDQQGNLTYYEVRINEDEHDYIHSNGLTTAAGQEACVTMEGGLNLPAGTSEDRDCAGKPSTYGQGVGAIEIKAAWRELPSDGSLDHRYKTAIADLHHPDGSTQQDVTVGLVGLHIIHKMQGAEQFLWSTFEHIDNAPDDNGGRPGAPQLPPNPNVTDPPPPYTYFNPQCVPTEDHYGCAINKLPGTPCTSPGVPTSCDPYSAPMQVTRFFPVASGVGGTAYQVTGYAWSLLPSDSTFNYYRLIDVQWPQISTPVAAGATIRLTPGSITSETKNVANTTLETFQQTNNCMSCHQGAPIALSQDCDRAACFASDYSFVFETETQD